MKTIEVLKTRRSYYNLNKDIKVNYEKLEEAIKEVTELVPDVFNMKSSRVVIVTGKSQNKLWDSVYDAFGGNVSREKIDSFKNAYGTILYFYDNNTVKTLQEKFSLYSENFPIWANQSSAMLQLSIWNLLEEFGLGANLQHYNPIIDENIKKLLDIPEEYILVAQMPFGNILSDVNPKEKEDINKRVLIRK